MTLGDYIAQDQIRYETKENFKYSIQSNQGAGAPIWAKSSLQSEGESRKYISKYIEVNTKLHCKYRAP